MGSGSYRWVGRRLLNAMELAAWARTQGFDDLVPSAWHVTIARSGEGLGADEMPLILRACRNRRVTRMGGLIVLELASSRLQRRHRQLHGQAAGRFRPHVSLTPDNRRDLGALVPFFGTLRFGPEEVSFEDGPRHANSPLSGYLPRPPLDGFG